MSAHHATTRATLPAHPLTVAGALLLAASDLRYLADRLARGEPLPPHTSRLLARYADECEAGDTEIRARELEVQRTRLLSRAMGDLVDDYQEQGR